MRRSRWLLLLLLLLGALALAAGCGSSDDSTSSTDAPAASTTASTKPVVEAPPTTPPTDVGISEPLPRTPPKGKKLIWLQCELPACQRFVQGMKDATAALGWDYKAMVYKDSAQAMRQAIQQKPDYIAITGDPSVVMKPELAMAAEAGIPVFACSSAEEPSPTTFRVMCGNTLARDAEYIARWVVNDSQGKANMVAVSIGQFPVLTTQTDWLKKNVTKLCPGCSIDTFDVTVDDVGAGAVGQKLAGYLQSHPDIDYVYFTFDDLARGIDPALKTTGLTDKVKLVGCCGGSAQIKEIGKSQAAWTIVPYELMSWTMVDAAARTSVGMDLGADHQRKVAITPSWVVDAAESAASLAPTYDWKGPEGFRETFKKLWKVAG